MNEHQKLAIQALRNMRGDDTARARRAFSDFPRLPTPLFGFWTPAEIKPTGTERKVLCWVVWPECGWPSPPEPIIGWWKHGPECFAVESVEHANHLVTHWAEIPEPIPAPPADVQKPEPTKP